jgi:hypothetical protein
MVACNSSNDDLKAIWSYEQSQTTQPDFRFYPLETKTIGQTTIGDSIQFISNDLTQPLDTLIRQNSRTLQSLLQLQSLYVKYDMETARETISVEINRLEAAQKWLNNLQNRVEEYKAEGLDKVLIRKVECRFEYDLPMSSKKVTKNKIYYIRTATGTVVLSEEKKSAATANS